MLERLVDEIQEAYNDHRAPEMWGTPEVSPGFFNHLKTDGIGSAWSYLVERERTLGDPHAKPEIKAIANLLGSALLILGVRHMTLGLLFFAQDGGTSHMGYLGKDPSQWDQIYRVNLTRSEQARVESEFDPSIDGCQMDTIARIYPDKLR